jgi:hypothetical protein
LAKTLAACLTTSKSGHSDIENRTSIPSGSVISRKIIRDRREGRREELRRRGRKEEGGRWEENGRERGRDLLERYEKTPTTFIACLRSFSSEHSPSTCNTTGSTALEFILTTASILSY